MREVTVKITNPQGLRVDTAGLLCKKAMDYKCVVELVRDNYTANVKSVLSLLGAGVIFGDELLLRCTGADEDAAIEVLTRFIEGGLED